MYTNDIFEKEKRNGGQLILQETLGNGYLPKEIAPLPFMPAQKEEQSVSIHDAFAVLWRQKFVILATFLVVTATALLGFKWFTPIYDAHVKILIMAEKSLQSPFYKELPGSFKSDTVLTQGEVVKSKPVLERVVKALELDKRSSDYEKRFASPLKQKFMDLESSIFPEQPASIKRRLRAFRKAVAGLEKNIKVNPVRNSNVFEIIVSDYDPAMAMAIANAVSRYYIIFDLEQQLAELQMKYGDKHMAVIQIKNAIAKVEQKLFVSPDSYMEAMGPASVKILEGASMPTDPSGMSRVLLLLVAAAAGLGLGVVLAFVLEHMDPTFRTVRDAEKSFARPLLGTISKQGLGTRMLTKKPLLPGMYMRSFEQLSERVHLLIKHKGLRTMLLTSVSRGEGTSTVVSNLATLLSRELGHKVLVVDANLRHPSLHKLFRVPNNLGLSDVLLGQTASESAIFPLNENLSLLPAGRYEGNMLTLFDGQNLGAFISEIKERYDIVLIDAAASGDYLDSEMAAPFVDGVLMVVEEGRTARQSAEACFTNLAKNPAAVMGVVMNKRVSA